jgi:hypothetical protein
MNIYYIGSMDAGPPASRGPAKRASSAQIHNESVKELKPTIISGISPEELNGLFIEQQKLYNQYVPLKIDCHGPLLRIKDYYDCFKVFQGPTVGLASGQVNSLNITGHFQFHSGLIVKKMPKENLTTDGKVNGIHVTLDDYVDFLEPFRRSSSLNIPDMGDGWKIHDDQSPPPNRGFFQLSKSPEGPELLRTDGLVKIVKEGQEQTVPFHQLLMKNTDVFENFQNKVNIVTGHNLSPALIDEHSLLFIHGLLTKQYVGDRNVRLDAIVGDLNQIHKDLVTYVNKQILDDITSLGLTSDNYMPQHLTVTDPKDRIPERLFAISVAQISSTASFIPMGYRYFLNGYSCVGTTAEDKYKCDDDQDIIRNPSLIKLMESLAFTLTFRVDMVFDSQKYFFSLILDREKFNDELKKPDRKKGVFKQYELYKDILHDSFKRCIVGALGWSVAATAAAEATAAAIEQLWPERTFDLIQNGCASIDHCMTLGKTLMLDKLYLQFHTKEPGADVITLRPNPFDTLTKLENISQKGAQMDPVVNVHLHFPKIRNVIKDHLSVPPGGGEIVKWSETVNDYDENIIRTLLAEDEGDDWRTRTLLDSVIGSLSVSIGRRDSSLYPEAAALLPQERSISPSTRTSSDSVGKRPITESVVRGIVSQPSLERIDEFVRSLSSRAPGNSTQNPPDDCAAPRGDAPRVGFFTQYRNALVALVEKLFKQPTGVDLGMGGGGGSLHKKPRRSKTRTRRNKKYSRKKGRRHSKYAKTYIKRRRVTYKK